MTDSEHNITDIRQAVADSISADFDTVRAEVDQMRVSTAKDELEKLVGKLRLVADNVNAAQSHHEALKHAHAYVVMQDLLVPDMASGERLIRMTERSRQLAAALTAYEATSLEPAGEEHQLAREMVYHLDQSATAQQLLASTRAFSESHAQLHSSVKTIEAHMKTIAESLSELGKTHTQLHEALIHFSVELLG
jgi:DNA repair exonuclease SbcCD ATPase subunit